VLPQIRRAFPTKCNPVRKMCFLEPGAVNFFETDRTMREHNVHRSTIALLATKKWKLFSKKQKWIHKQKWGAPSSPRGVSATVGSPSDRRPREASPLRTAPMPETVKKPARNAQQPPKVLLALAGMLHCGCSLGGGTAPPARDRKMSALVMKMDNRLLGHCLREGDGCMTNRKIGCCR
jgi:hypothetical protein